MKAKRTNQESLVYKRTQPGGKVEAVHSWATGYQVLVFEDRGAFDRAVEGIAKKNAEQPIRVEA